MQKKVNSDCTESAGFNKVLTYVKDESSKDKSCFFKLKDLFDMYLDRTNGNSDDRKYNKTRFKDSILTSVPTLCEIKAGRDVFLMMKSNLETFFDEAKRLKGTVKLYFFLLKKMPLLCTKNVTFLFF